MGKTVRLMKNINTGILILSFVIGLAGVFMVGMAVEKEKEVITKHSSTSTKDFGLAMIAAALSTGLSSIGAGIAVSAVGASAVAAISEKPETIGKALIFVGMAEGIAIYGLVVSIMILVRV